MKLVGLRSLAGCGVPATVLLSGCFQDEEKASTAAAESVNAETAESEESDASVQADTVAEDDAIAEGLDEVQQAARRAAMEAGQAMVAAMSETETPADAHTDEGEAEPEEAAHETWTESEPPLSAEAIEDHTARSMGMSYFRVRSHADRLEVRSITLNRGNCIMAETGQVTTGIDLPIALRFGAAKRYRVQGCSRVIEATIDTQYGPYTFRW